MMAERAQKKLLTVRQSLEKHLIITGGVDTLLTKERLAILAKKPMDLLQELKDGKVSVIAVLEAFQAKAIEESKRTNCVTGFIPEAKEWAQELDSMRKDSKVQDMPLFGLPLSVKDMISVKGMDATLGLEKKVDKPAEKDAVHVQLFKRFGAVPFVMTTVPQLCMSILCSNPVFGETVNPYDTTRTCGGSSGGEAALIGGGGSLLGLGTDVAGSVRIPAHWCGIASIKPTARRATKRGTVAPAPPTPGVYGTIGIMGKDAQIVVEATKAFYSIDQSQFDVEVPPVEWREHLFSATVERPLKQKLRIGYYTDLGKITPTPGVVRSVLESVEILKNLGHEVVPFQPPFVEAALKLWIDLLMCDGGVNLLKTLEGEKIDPSLEYFMDTVKVPAKLREIGKPFIQYLYGEHGSDMLASTETTVDLLDRIVGRMIYVGQFSGAWKQQNLDLLLSPGWPIPAPPKHAQPSLVAALGAYTLIYNLLDFPCGIVPVTKETLRDQELLETYTLENENLARLIKKYTKGSVGMPLAVQFVALPFCEEIICRIMVEFSKAVDFKP